MKSYELTTISEVLKNMGDLELAIGELYQTCGQLWSEHKEFWMDMEKAEFKHADNLDRMNQIISERPENFELGRSFSPIAIKTFLSGIKSIIQGLKEKKIDEIKILFLARDIEQSYLENKYVEITKTEDNEFKSLMREIHSDTVFHRDYLNNKIREFTST
jgi:hypothetical protein